MSLDFLAIGDIVSEPFIKLKDAQVQETPEGQLLAMRFGDKIPYESKTMVVAVGNASNAAVSAARLGLNSALHAYIGNDRYGKECLETLEKEGVSTEYMVTEEGKESNYHFVLWYGSDRTILVKHEEFSYAVPALKENPKWVYLSSLSDHSLPYHNELVTWLNENPDVKFAFQPGTFQMSLGTDALAGMYARTDFFVCNKEEAERILKLPHGTDVKELIAALHALGPKMLAITDGTEGAYASDGTNQYFVPMYPDTRGPFERTGAGDAFASSVTAALALGKPFTEALLWGPINSMSVVQEVGAQQGLLTREKLEEYLAAAPADYIARAL